MDLAVSIILKKFLQIIMIEGDTMKIFLCGGGCGAQVSHAYQRLYKEIDHGKPCLYIPFAMECEDYQSCYEWVSEELKSLCLPGIDMAVSGKELCSRNLNDYAFIFIGGGNTFRLLKELKDSGAFTRIKQYLEKGGTIFGGSAGAIIFGKDLDACRLDDPNRVGLMDTEGFDLLDGISILCHFSNGPKEKDEKNEEYLRELSWRRTILALPEEDTLLVCGEVGQSDSISAEMIGDRPYFIFQDGEKITRYFSM